MQLTKDTVFVRPTIVIALMWKRIGEITALRTTAHEASDVTVAGWSLARKRLTTEFITVEAIVRHDTYITSEYMYCAGIYDLLVFRTCISCKMSGLGRLL